MSDHENQPQQLPQTEAIPLKYHDTESSPAESTTKTEPMTNKTSTSETTNSELGVKPPQQISCTSHTFIVSSVLTEEKLLQEAVETKEAADQEQTEITADTEAKFDSLPCCSINCSIPLYIGSRNNAVVPLSSSLPSKLLRLHAKRSAQALLQQIESLDSQFGSDEDGAAGGCSNDNDCADIFDVPTPTTPRPLSPRPPRSTPVDCIDGGMGSSIEDSEESEVDDELKPLAVDNHVVMHDIDLNSSGSGGVCTPPISPQESAILSEANLEKFHKHHHTHTMDNIYMHPNFKYQLHGKVETPEVSPPPVVAPANSPTEQKRVHRSFLTMCKKPSQTEFELERANSVISNPASIATTEPNGDQPLVNEIDTLDPALIPNDELAAEITEAVEYYFSNECILKDAFLLKHVRRNKEGFVSLKLVSSFKRVRQLTKEWKVVGNAVRRKSRKIELNDVGTKVRRLEALPNFDETMPSRTIVACDLPLDKLTIEKVSDIFSKCGEIALIRILKPGMAIPVDVRQFMNKYPEMQQKECALVEYLESSAAREAKHLQGSFQVFDMVAPKKKTGKKAAVIQVATPVTRMVENYRYYNDASYERTRGGSFSGIVPHEGDLRFKLRRNNSDFHTKNLPDFSQAQPLNNSSSSHHHYQPQHFHRHNSLNGSGEHIHHQQQFHYQPRGSIGHETAVNNAGPASPSNNMNFFAFSPRRYSNASTALAGDTQSHTVMDAVNSHSGHTNGNNNNSITNHNNGSTLSRRLSNCSADGYTAEMTRRTSNCSENAVTPPQRRDSNCSENCPCTRRISDFGHAEVFRKTSQGSIGSGERRFSNGSLQFERSFSNVSDHSRRMSNDFQHDRKQSLETQTGLAYNHPNNNENDGNVGGGGGGYNVFRRYSNNFNNSVSNKLAQYDNAQYINGRRISTDSGYDRRYSFGSEYEGSPRSRTGSFLNSYKHGSAGCGEFDGSPRSRTNSFLEGASRSRSGSFALRNTENLVRTPLGPDGSRGFGSRARKFGQAVSPVN